MAERPQFHRIVPDGAHHLCHVFRWAQVFVFALQNGLHHIFCMGPRKGGVRSQVIIHQVRHAGVLRTYRGLIPGAGNRPGPVALIEPQPGDVVPEQVGVAFSRCVGQAFKEQPADFQGRTLGSDPLVQSTASPPRNVSLAVAIQSRKQKLMSGSCRTMANPSTLCRMFSATNKMGRNRRVNGLRRWSPRCAMSRSDTSGNRFSGWFRPGGSHPDSPGSHHQKYVLF